MAAHERIERDATVADRVVVVTGAGGGIGGASARLLAALGARVVITDAADPGLAETEAGMPTGTPAIVADLTDEAGAEQVVAAAIEAFGRVDALVSAAGIYRMSPAATQDLAEARRIIDANVIGAINIGVLAMQHMGPGSSIVNFTSGAQWGMRDMAPYAASKGAIASLTYAWALDLSERDIRVNAIAPTAATGMTEVLFDTIDLGPSQRAEQRRLMAAPNEIAPLVAYLVSTRSTAVTGQVIRLDRGKLSIVSHPTIVEPVLTRDRWTLDAIDTAMSTDLRAEPNGDGGPRVDPADGSTDADG